MEIVETGLRGNCIVIESMQGKAKLIIRTDRSESNLMAFNFPSLKDCLEFINKNQFKVNTIYSGKGRDKGPKT